MSIIIEPSEPGRVRRVTNGWMALSMIVGLALTLTTSGGIVVERLTRGLPELGLLVTAMETAVAMAAVLATMRPLLATFVEVPEDGAGPARAYRMRVLALLGPQLVGAIAGVCIVHLLLCLGVFGTDPWLSERPAQFVNDAVAAVAPLALVWACARELDARLLALALVGLTAYVATARSWHLDHAPGGFHVTIQHFVVAEWVATALGLGLFRSMFQARGRPSGTSAG